MDLDIENQVTSQSGANITKQVFWGLAFLFFSSQFLLFRYKARANKPFNKQLLLLISLGIIGLISAIWAEYPIHSLKRSVFQIMFVTVIAISAFYSVAYGTFERSVRIASFTVITFVLISVVMGVAFTSKGDLAGSFQNKNTLAIVVLTLLALNYLVAMRRTFGLEKANWKDWVIIFILVGFLFLSGSKTNIIIFSFLPIFHFTNIKVLRLAVFSVFAGICILFIYMPISYLFTEHYVVVADFVGDDFITGRGIIWKTIYYDLIKFDKLYFGYGYGSYFGVPQIPYYFDDSFSFLRFINSAHNGYLELLTQFGIVFSSLTVIVIGYLIYSLQKKEELVIIMIPVLQNITESSFLRDNAVYWFLFILLVCLSRVSKKELLHE